MRWTNRAVRLGVRLAMAGAIGLGGGALAQSHGERPIPTGERPIHTGPRPIPTGERGAPNTGSRVAPNREQPATRQPPGTNPGRGVRAPGGGVRAPAGGVRAPDNQNRVVAPGRPGNGHGGRPGDGPGRPGRPGHDCDHKHGCRCIWYPSWGWWSGWGGWGWGSRWSSLPYSWSGGVVRGPETEFEGNEEEAVELTDLELALVFMRRNEPEEAARWFESHLRAFPNDVEVMRSYAAALIGAGRMADGVAMLAYAYDAVPGLASRPMERSLWGDSPARLRRAVEDAVRYAQRTPSASAWLTVTVLIQAEGRDAVALRMLERAESLGLGPAVADRLRLRLTRR